MIKKIIKVILPIIYLAFLSLGILLFFSAKWYIGVYGCVGFDSILYTLSSSLKSIEKSLILSYLKNALLPCIITILLVFSFLFLKTRRCLVFHFGESFKFKLYPLGKGTRAYVSLVLSLVFIYSSALNVGFIEYIKYTGFSDSKFHEYYVHPLSVDINFPKEKQNLIYIYLESMETTFTSHSLGGGIDANVIPELYKMAQENTNFSHTGSFGGIYPLSGSHWTIAAMVSYTAGIPLKVPFALGGNEYGKDGFLPGVTSLTDILNENGYYQALMVGSDSNFGGRRQFYEGHKTDKVYDYYTAIDDGIIPKDHFVWWGMEDSYLIEYAKEALSSIAFRDKPFAFTMLTVDTHHIGGYYCKDCLDKFSEQYENVLACSSKQISEFVNWIKQQDFYENTTIIISGDHYTMDANYIKNNVSPDYRRTVYNCFINSKVCTDNTKNRVICTYDMFPTTLAAIGAQIEGERLGLGTNIFSSTPTLCETMGMDTFNMEIARDSQYYTDEFLK